MSNCSCAIATEADAPSFCNVEYRKARKVHKCGECFRAINVGEHYEYVSGMWDGNFSRFKTCTDCVAVRDAFFCDGHTLGSVWQDLWQHIDYTGGNISSGCIAGLPKIARDKVCDMIEEVWGQLMRRKSRAKV